LTQREAEAMVAWRRTLSVEEERRVIARLGIQVITWADPDYPPLLREIADPPAVLFLLGKRRCLQGPAVALVGTRRATGYGLAVARTLGRALVQEGVTVVSGLALGIDAAGHWGALEGLGPDLNGKEGFSDALASRPCPTIAVLGGGLDRIYPRENRRLAAAIAREGALISEFLPGLQPEKYHFPLRNRLISGLAAGVVVVEAPEKSGALITADLALEQGRSVLAVPGNITSAASRGSNRLIQQGARPLLTPEDVLEELGWTGRKREGDQKGVTQYQLSQEEWHICHLLQSGPSDIEELVEKSGYTASQLTSLVTQLEVKDMIRRVGSRIELLPKVDFSVAKN